ncbi:hypothetical protein [Mycolicibacterium moriokaense]|uniref:Lipoprotein LpqN n=1 Tax=Mycolicibacterium moriokaense TaxID=39691 RepID=A0A318H6X9_9MYCO|nr:hypothetical protein [Mycolicibacterium moriokaense]PXX00276.1 hypothetical protein C8E89_13623 [Mycolicibacterium moriokaense]
MANRSILVVSGLAVSSILLSGAVAGCGSKSSTTSSSSSSSASSSKQATSTSASASAEPSDYSTLLIKATDIVVPNDTFSAMPAQPNPGGQPGVAGSFTNAAGNRVIGDTIMILPDASAAAKALDGAVAALGNNVTGAPQSASVGSNGVVASGPSPDNSKFVAVLLFTEGKAFTTIEFDSAADDPVPPEVVMDIGQKQDDAIKKGLPA